jgi:hypothetical protein
MIVSVITGPRADIAASRAQWQAGANFLRSRDWQPTRPEVFEKARDSTEQPRRMRLTHGPNEPAALSSPPVGAGMPRGSELLASGDYYILGFRRLITWLAR